MTHHKQDEGTHVACDARIKSEGGKARCCYCVPHEGCNLPTVRNDAVVTDMVATDPAEDLARFQSAQIPPQANDKELEAQIINAVKPYVSNDFQEDRAVDEIMALIHKDRAAVQQKAHIREVMAPLATIGHFKEWVALGLPLYEIQKRMDVHEDEVRKSIRQAKLASHQKEKE